MKLSELGTWPIKRKFLIEDVPWNITCLTVMAQSNLPLPGAELKLVVDRININPVVGKEGNWEAVVTYKEAK